MELGLVLLGRAGNPEAIATAVGTLGESDDPRIRQVIAQKYAALSTPKGKVLRDALALVGT